ncbi:MAG: TonB family protein [Chloroflexota bacterium]|nr:TonB family protein [Chloroflexota bacterium]
MAAILFSSHPLRAQASAADGAIAGVVRDAAGAGIAGAQLTVAGTAIRAVSDERGAFRLAPVPSGPTSVQARRLGFRAADAAVIVEPGRTVAVTLTLASAPQELAPVVVRRGDRRYAGPLAEFSHRRGEGFGHFITRDQISQHEQGRLTDVLRRVPSVRVIADEFGNTGVRLRGTACAPVVLVDGMPASVADFDLDAIPPQTLEGIEVYSDVATVPLELRSPTGFSNCGVIALWSRHGEPRRRRPRGKAATGGSRSTAELRVFTAEQVDVPARVNATAPIRPVYPPSLYRAGIAGSVIAMFVVDTAGRADTDTFIALSSSHPLFTDAVRRAVQMARFVPAVRQGRAVRQLVRLPFRFVIGRGRK